MTGWTSTKEGRHLRGRPKVGTTPELLLRRALHAAGARFRLHPRLARGCTPDIVLPRRRIAVFVDGDYWHSCPIHGRQLPFSGPNAGLWQEKMQRNRERDLRSTSIAQGLGWVVVRAWECSVQADAAEVARAVLAGQSLPPSARRD